MTVHINNKKISNIYYDNKAIKKAYISGKKIFDNTKIGDTYNYLIYDTSLLDNKDNTIVLYPAYVNKDGNYYPGPLSPWTGFTDWGDGTIDDLFYHTYSTSGIYTIRTRHLIHCGPHNFNDYDIFEVDGVEYKTTCEAIIGCEGNINNVKVSKLFGDCEYITSLDLSRCNTSEVTSMNAMFYGCSGMKYLNLYNLDVRNVTTLKSAFEGCINLESIKMFNPPTNKLQDISYMFAGCNNIESLDLSGWDTSNVFDATRAFLSCRKLKRLNLSGWDLTGVRNDGIYYDTIAMFDDCQSLTLDNIIMDGCNSKTKQIITFAFNNRILV